MFCFLLVLCSHLFFFVLSFGVVLKCDVCFVSCFAFCCGCAVLCSVVVVLCSFVVLCCDEVLRCCVVLCCVFFYVNLCT